MHAPVAGHRRWGSEVPGWGAGRGAHSEGRRKRGHLLWAAVQGRSRRAPVPHPVTTVRRPGSGTRAAAGGCRRGRGQRGEGGGGAVRPRQRWAGEDGRMALLTGRELWASPAPWPPSGEKGRDRTPPPPARAWPQHPAPPPHGHVDDDEHEQGEGRHAAAHDERHRRRRHLLHVLRVPGQRDGSEAGAVPGGGGSPPSPPRPAPCPLRACASGGAGSVCTPRPVTGLINQSPCQAGRRTPCLHFTDAPNSRGGPSPRVTDRSWGASPTSGTALPGCVLPEYPPRAGHGASWKGPSEPAASVRPPLPQSQFPLRAPAAPQPRQAPLFSTPPSPSLLFRQIPALHPCPPTGPSPSRLFSRLGRRIL